MYREAERRERRVRRLGGGLRREIEEGDFREVIDRGDDPVFDSEELAKIVGGREPEIPSRLYYPSDRVKEHEERTGKEADRDEEAEDMSVVETTAFLHSATAVKTKYPTQSPAATAIRMQRMFLKIFMRSLPSRSPTPSRSVCDSGTHRRIRPDMSHGHTLPRYRADTGNQGRDISAWSRSTEQARSSAVCFHNA